MSYLHQEQLNENNFPLFASFTQSFGLIPNFYRAQTMRTDLVEAEAQLVGTILVTEDALTRQQKDTSFSCVRRRILARTALQLTARSFVASTNLPLVVKAQLNFTLKLNNQPNKMTRSDVEALRTYGFNDQQILEAVAVVGLAKFANYVAFGLGTLPDFDSSKIVFQGTEAAVR